MSDQTSCFLLWVSKYCGKIAEWRVLTVTRLFIVYQTISEKMN